jgi:hypothetical protein
MLALFVAVQTTAYFRGLNISCGCFGPEHDTPIGWFTLPLVVSLFTLSLIRNVPAFFRLKSTRKIL